MQKPVKNKQYYKFCGYGFLKNLRFFDAFFILFLVEKGLTFTEIGILYAVREILINVFEIPSGIFADTYGRKNSLLGSLVLYIFSFFVFWLSSSFWPFLIAFVLYGIADAFRSGTHKAMIMDYLKIHNWESEKINYYGHTRACSQKGSALSALAAGVLVFYYGTYELVFLFSIIPYLLNFLLIFSYPKVLNITNTLNGVGTRISFREITSSFVQIIKQPNVLKILNSAALHTAFQRAVKDYIQPLMLQVALLIPILIHTPEQKKSGLIIGIIYFIIYLFTSYASKKASNFNSMTKQTSYTTLIYGFSFGLLSGVFYVYELWTISLVFFIGIYLIENIRKPILTGILADNVPNEILTSVISAQSLWKTIITAVIAVCFGFFADYFGIGVAFIIIAGFLLFATFLTSKLVKTE